MTLEYINQELQTLKEKKNYRSLPPLIHKGRDVLLNGQRMLNLSSNDFQQSVAATGKYHCDDTVYI